VPSGKANGENVFLPALPSGVTSPSLTADSPRSRSTKDSNLFLLIRPTGSRRTRTRAGATGERGSPPIGTSERFGAIVEVPELLMIGSEREHHQADDWLRNE